MPVRLPKVVALFVMKVLAVLSGTAAVIAIIYRLIVRESWLYAISDGWWARVGGYSWWVAVLGLVLCWFLRKAVRKHCPDWHLLAKLGLALIVSGVVLIVSTIRNELYLPEDVDIAFGILIAGLVITFADSDLW